MSIPAETTCLPPFCSSSLILGRSRPGVMLDSSRSRDIPSSSGGGGEGIHMGGQWKGVEGWLAQLLMLSVCGDV